jgi:hypothetical protein
VALEDAEPPDGDVNPPEEGAQPAEPAAPQPSLYEQMARLETKRKERKLQGRRRPEGAGDPMAPRSGWIEDEDLYGDQRDLPEAIEDRDRRRRVFSRQVCVRLSFGQFGELEHAAELYGVATSTMARILVRRGARAVLEHYRRYDLEQGGRD